MPLSCPPFDTWNTQVPNRSSYVQLAGVSAWEPSTQSRNTHNNTPLTFIASHHAPVYSTTQRFESTIITNKELESTYKNKYKTLSYTSPNCDAPAIRVCSLSSAILYNQKKLSLQSYDPLQLITWLAGAFWEKTNIIYYIVKKAEWPPLTTEIHVLNDWRQIRSGGTIVANDAQRSHFSQSYRNATWIQLYQYICNSLNITKLLFDQISL